MANDDSGWRPEGAMDTYRGFEVWEYNVGPHQINHGEVDGDVRIQDTDADVDLEEEL
jgi:hypothetical protein